MIESTDAYKNAITGGRRKIEISAVIDISDPDAVLLTPESSSIAPWVKPEELHDKVMSAPARYSTLEKNRWSLDGSFRIFPDDYKVDENMGYALDELSGDDGTFSTPQWVILPFEHMGVLQAFSVFFSTDAMDGIGVDFTVDLYQGGTAYFSKTVTGNTKAKVDFDGFTVYNPDRIKITVTKWSLPSRRVRVVEIIPGVYEQWTGDQIAEFNVQQYGDFSCLTLPYSTCDIKMDNLDRRFEPRSKNGVFQSIEERQAIDVRIGVRLEDGSTDYKRAGIFYQFADGWKTGDNGMTMAWSLVDIVGLLSKREYILPDILPTTLSGWIESFVSQLGENFTNRYHVDPNYAEIVITAKPEDVTGQKVGDLLRYACMAAGVWPRADAETGYLTAEPLWSQGNKLTLDNMPSYPILKANTGIAALIFTLSSGVQYVVSGNSTSSEQTVSIQNPFIHSESEALTAARLILSCYGGNTMEVTSRGDPSSEIGDVDTVWLNESTATTGRRMAQSFAFTNGVMMNCQSTLLQADGSFLFQQRDIITKSGTWTAPEGVTKIRLILVGKGSDGERGADGTFDYEGAQGANGLGGLVWSETFNINPGQSFSVEIGEDTIFGEHSSANGDHYENGYTDVASGDSFARTGVANPLPGSGDGGAGGAGGHKGETHSEKWTWNDADGNFGEYEETVIDRYPGTGEPGAKGATGCAVVYFDTGV